MKPSSDKGDICPSKIVIQHAHLFAPAITRIINASIRHNTVPSEIKTVWVTPIPKKPSGNPKDPANLRPITNVTFLLKVLDKVATAQFQTHLETHKILHPRQSGFRKGHSTETALLDLQNQMFNALDQNRPALLVLLDLSAAFDLLDHSILLDRLHHTANCSPDTITWFKSFLEGRTSKILWESAESPSESIMYGVPQGACLSPSLFNVYLKPLFDSLSAQNIPFTNYADDTQLLLELTGNHKQDTATLNTTYATIKTWMDQNWMCLNAAKTELMLVASNTTKHKLGPLYQSFLLEGNSIAVAYKVKTLGVYLDAAMTMEPHTNNLVRTTSYHIKLLRQLAPYLTEENRAAIGRASILSRLDYCNSLLAKTSEKNSHKIQVIQNNAVRAITTTAKRSHISDKRRELHWLPVKERIIFKTLLIAFKALHNKGPTYLQDAITERIAPRPLRSTAAPTLQIPRFRKTHGNGKSFTHAAPTAWNNLPQETRSLQNLDLFKKATKTLLFK